MKAKGVYRDIRSFLEEGLGPQLELEAAGLSVGKVRRYELGWRDPFGLSEYNQILVVPDRLAPDRERKLLSVPLAIVAALKAKSAEALVDDMAVYADALGSLFENDPSAGGRVFEALLEDVDFSLPAPGSAPVGTVTFLLTVSLDQIF